MKLKKGKLYEVIWTNPWTCIITMQTAYDRDTVYVRRGKVLLYLGNRKVYYTVKATRTTEEIKLEWRKHKFLYGTKVVSWDEKKDNWDMLGGLGLAGVFKEIEKK